MTTAAICASREFAWSPSFYRGEQYDSDLALYYLRARYYNPATGRFLSEDPLGYAGGDTNLYRYVRNDPNDFVDAYGTTQYSVTHNLPANAVPYVTQDGYPFFAPPGANWSQEYSSGQQNGMNPFAMNQNIGQGGIYDYQRDASAQQFISDYTNASNYGVGVYMNGAGFSLAELIALGEAYALLNSSNAGSDAQLNMWIAGWEAANTGMYSKKNNKCK
jgi:RHS repeat-associated protein